MSQTLNDSESQMHSPKSEKFRTSALGGKAKLSNGSSEFAKLKFYLTILSVMIGITLPGVGFIASNVMSNKETGAVLTKLVNMHVDNPIHTNSASNSQLKAAIESVQKQQEIRYENIKSELVEIKTSLRELRKK